MKTENDRDGKGTSPEFPIPNSKFPIPNSKFPSPNSKFAIPNSKFPIQEDICARTFTFATNVVVFCHQMDKRSGTGRTLCKQLLRSGTSIGANVEEAQSGQSRADFLSKMQIACKEARETHYWLRLLTATEIVPKEDLAALVQEANEIVAILTAIIKNTKANAK